MIRSRDDLLDMLNRLEKNPHTAQYMVRASKPRRSKSAQERLIQKKVAATEESKPPIVDPFTDAHAIQGGQNEADIVVAPESGRWMNIEAVKAYVGISTATIYRMINSHGFPRPKKLCRSSRWDREEIDAYMEALPVMVIPKLDWINGKPRNM